MRGLLGLIAKVGPYLRPYRWRFLASASLVVALSGAEILKPWPLKIVVDCVLGGKPLAWLGYPEHVGARTLLLLAALGLVALYVLIGVLSVASNYLTIDVGQLMVNDFRSDLYQHLQRLSLRFHTQRGSGDLMYRLTADTFAIQTLAMNGFFPTVSALVMLVGMILVMARLDWQLTLMALAICPLLAAAISQVGRRITRVATDAREKESRLYSVAQRAMSSIKVIQAFTSEEDEHRSFIDVSRASLDANLSLYTVQTAYSMAVNVIGAIGTAGVIWFGATHVMSGTLTIGDLLVFTTYLASLYAPINTISSTYGLIQGAKVGIGRVFEILETAPDVPDGARTLARADVRGEVAFENVSFSYQPEQPVLRELSFHVAPGETIAIVGPTGAGKSTLVSLLVRFYDPSSGRVLLDGQDLRTLTVRSLRRQVAMVLQPPLVFPTTVRENIAYGRRDASLDEIRAAARAAQLEPLLEKLPHGLDTAVGEKGATLSEGECQRLTIARAILRDAPILIFDEPTSALDAETEALLMGSLEELMRKRTTFVIAHRLSTVRRASRIMVLREGRIVELGSFAELMARRGYFAKLHETQFGTAPGEAVRAAT
ncbi:MAG TPA: ABC transporter ATP-binding protein [Candidatus Bathyarchaeia archaeon]|nr:ABC transporter ATP-binding protein [Candidatus Bathyarchaeia archaeon]